MNYDKKHNYFVCSQVKYWVTMDSPWVTAVEGYGLGNMAPGVHDPGTALYLAGQNQLMAHARAWHIYNDKFKPLQQGV